MIVGIIRRKPVLTHASIVCGGMLASVNLVNVLGLGLALVGLARLGLGFTLELVLVVGLQLELGFPNVE